MHTKYLGLAAMTVLLGAQAIAIPRPFEQTNDKVMKRANPGIKAPTWVTEPEKWAKSKEIEKEVLEGKLVQDIKGIENKIPQDIKGIENKIPQDIKDIKNKVPQDTKNKIPKKYKSLIGPIAEAIAKGDQNAILAKIKLVLPLIKSEIPKEALEAKLKELVALLPKGLPKKEIEGRLMKAVELLLQKLPKAELEKGLDGLKPVFQKGVDAVENKVEGKKEGKKEGEKKPDLLQADGIETEKFEQQGEEGEAN